jgi:multidrug efflux pump subunit AcrB
LPPGFHFDVGGATQEQDDAFGAMGLAVVFIYIVLIAHGVLQYVMVGQGAGSNSTSTQ